MKVDAIVRYYKLRNNLLWGLHVLTVPVVILVSAWALMGKMDIMNLPFSILGAGFANYLFYALRKMNFQSLNSILTTNCDPVKYEAVFRQIDPALKSPETALNVARGLYYQGKWEESLQLLREMPKFKESSGGIYQFMHIQACCYEMAEDMEKVFEIREKARRLLKDLKPKSRYIGNANQLVSILDGMITMNRGSFSKAREITEELFDSASFALSRLNASLRLAKMEQKIGAGRSAIERCEYIIDDGGTTYFVEEAKKILALCRGNRTEQPEALPEEITEEMPEESAE